MLYNILFEIRMLQNFYVKTIDIKVLMVYNIVLNKCSCSMNIIRMDLKHKKQSVNGLSFNQAAIIGSASGSLLFFHVEFIPPANGEMED